MRRRFRSVVCFSRPRRAFWCLTRFPGERKCTLDFAVDGTGALWELPGSFAVGEAS
jgi:hypothetical protein